MKPRNKNINDWFEMIRSGQLTLPRFQRGEDWNRRQIGDVLMNVLREPSLPIGAILVLETGGEEMFKSRPIASAPEPKGMPTYYLLDGQQRMTAIWRSLNDSYLNEGFTLFVTLDDESQPSIDIKARYRKEDGEYTLKWADSPEKCLEKNLVPVKVLIPGPEGESIMNEWVNQACKDDNEKYPNLYKRILTLRGRVSNYQIPFLMLPRETEKETAIDVFIRMNTSSSPLSDYDFVVANLEMFDEYLPEKISQLREDVPAAAEYGNVESMALAVGALLQERRPLRSTYLNRDYCKELPKVWDDVVYGIKHGVDFLRDEMIFNRKLLPTEVIVNLACALWAKMPRDGTDEKGRVLMLIRKAIWRAGFTSRYEKTATTRTHADYMAILKLIKDPSSRGPDLFDDEQYPLPEPEELIYGKPPSGTDRLGRAIMVTSLYCGGYDFADGAKANPESVKRPHREYHHLYPKSLVQNTFQKHEIDSALNFALISWRTNRKIHAKWPGTYIKERAQADNVSESQVRQRVESHLIPYNELVADDFKNFLNVRARLIHKAMKKLTDGSLPCRVRSE